MSNAAPAAIPDAADRSGFVEVDSHEALREILGRPHQLVIDKVRQRLVAEDVEMLAHSPFCLVSTSDAHGNCDASPRGGSPGFTHVLDSGTLALPDRPGNRRGDSFRNVLDNPHVGLLHLVPGSTDVLRVNGRARVLRDAPFFEEMKVKGQRPQLALLVEIDEVYRHCPQSLRRASLWNPETW
ncbi:MSMEG_1061 family FMN-dependent PPOX-type flavoprotein [Streptomyces iconiensis]|uniref:Pyridoxamine 5'-phosphate oxidase family protein n=1 Tax=Streptomyces iconiensis TaxID=1384038 RepID=A0ABT6ZWD5_9ACTN|nr:MSMEG_1061 family FMN-dependent PPOX-type flavoprotein [Streptomyces iconiensis]MDJ1133375.1 pyridoxamine 5'-phosphate oxidase family protein [Streptomyces iconiensis]